MRRKKISVVGGRAALPGTDVLRHIAVGITYIIDYNMLRVATECLSLFSFFYFILKLK